MFVLAVQTEIFDTGYRWIVHLSFLTSHNLLFFKFCKTSKKNNIFGFSVVFSRKIAQISIFKVEYLENGLADCNDFGLILQDFERPFRWNQLVLALQFSFKYSNKIDKFCQIPELCEFEVKWKWPFWWLGKLNICVCDTRWGYWREKFKPERKLFETEKASKIQHVNKFFMILTTPGFS